MSTMTETHQIMRQQLGEGDTSYTDMGNVIADTWGAEFDGIDIVRDMGRYQYGGRYTYTEQVVGYHGEPPEYGPGHTVWSVDLNAGTVEFQPPRWGMSPESRP